ncbi:hypothetical protein ILYODFUR_027423 [Ilyodon furcidens]|uniref:Secreted protein n=1 Tax=Ilyodon furcidens TaxID=33524 RepID=A0ABV0SRY0_9TELE
MLPSPVLSGGGSGRLCVSRPALILRSSEAVLSACSRLVVPLCLLRFVSVIMDAAAAAAAVAAEEEETAEKINKSSIGSGAGPRHDGALRATKISWSSVGGRWWRQCGGGGCSSEAKHRPAAKDRNTTEPSQQ